MLVVRNKDKKNKLMNRRMAMTLKVLKRRSNQSKEKMRRKMMRDLTIGKEFADKGKNQEMKRSNKKEKDQIDQIMMMTMTTALMVEL